MHNILETLLFKVPLNHITLILTLKKLKAGPCLDQNAIYFG